MHNLYIYGSLPRIFDCLYDILGATAAHASSITRRLSDIEGVGKLRREVEGHIAYCIILEGNHIKEHPTARILIMKLMTDGPEHCTYIWLS